MFKRRLSVLLLMLDHFTIHTTVIYAMECSGKLFESIKKNVQFKMSKDLGCNFFV